MTGPPVRGYYASEQLVCSVDILSGCEEKGNPSKKNNQFNKFPCKIYNRHYLTGILLLITIKLHMSEIGKKISKTRKDQSLTQIKLSEKAGVDYNTLRKVETGKILNPSSDFLKKVSSALNVSINDITEAPKPNVTGSDYLPFLKLSPERFEDLVEMVVSIDSLYKELERYGARGDKSRDIIAKLKEDKSGGNTLFQAKRYTKTTLSVLTAELDSIKEHFFTSKTDVATPINNIKFCLADSPSPSIKDDTKIHAKKLGLPEPIFLEARSLNLICRASEKIMNEFFAGHIEELKSGIKEITKNQSSNKDEIINKISDLQDQLLNQKQLISVGINEDAEMVKARRLIQERKYSEAKEILLGLKPMVEYANDPQKLKKIYNNLGICFSFEPNQSGLEKGMDFLERAVLLDKDFNHPKKNFIRIVLDNGIKTRYNDVQKYANDLIAQDPNDPEYIALYIMYLNVVREFKEAKDFIEKKYPYKENLVYIEYLFSNITQTYFALGELETASEIVDMGLKKFPESVSLNRFKGRIIMSGIEKGGARFRDFDDIPFFLKANNAKEAIEYFEKACLYARNDSWYEIEINFIKVELFLACVISNRDKSINFEEKIKDDLLPNDQREFKLVVEASQKLKEKKYQDAFEIYYKLINDFNYPYDRIKKIAEKFWRLGSPEFSIKILLPLSAEAKDIMDIEYWALMSLSYALIGKKNEALSIMNEAKTIFVRDQEKYLKILAHYGALAGRYQSSESDRMVSSVFELHKLLPEKKILTSVEAVNPDGSISDEMKKFFIDAKASFEKKREVFLNNPIPVSFLKQIFDRSFAEALEIPHSNGDLKFIIPYNSPDPDFTNIQDKHFNESDDVIIDYFSLLNFTRCGQLGLFRALGKKVLASEYLLFEVQQDLALRENEHIREAWNFLRSEDVHLFTYQDEGDLDKNIIKNIKGIFNDSEWLVQSLMYCIKNKKTLLTDDLRLLNLASSKDMEIKSINSFVFFRTALARQFIDRKQYSLILGELADLLLHFIPFNGEDLLNIVLDDETKIKSNQIIYFKWVEECPTLKISLRTYHLLNQAKLPNSILESFLVVALEFFMRIYRLGILDEDKVDWAVFLSNFFYDNSNGVSAEYIEFSIKIWSTVINNLPTKHKGLITEKISFLKNTDLRNFVLEKLDNKNL